LDNNKLISLPEEFGKLPRLSILDLCNNKHLTNLPKSFKELKNLATLKILNCQINKKEISVQITHTDIWV